MNNEQPTDLQHLKRIREWLADPSHWCKGTMAKYHNSSYGDPEALKSTCLVGAVYRESGELGKSPRRNYAVEWYTLRPLRQRLLSKLHRFVRTPTIPLWNDDSTRTHQDVLDLLDKAIEAERKCEM